MILSIVDFTGKEPSAMIAEFEKHGIPVLSGSLRELERKTEERKRDEPDDMIAWIIEDGKHKANQALLIKPGISNTCHDQNLLERIRERKEERMCMVEPFVNRQSRRENQKALKNSKR